MALNKKVKLAIFDIDGTIFRSSLLIELFYDLVKTGVFPEKAKDEIESSYTAWLDRQGDYNTYLASLIQAHYKYHKGHQKNEIDKAVLSVVNNQKNRVYRYTRDLIKQLKRTGYVLVAISGSPEYIVSKFAESLGFDASFGRILEVNKGIFTGRIHDGTKFIPGDILQDKKQILKNFIRQSGLSVSLKDSIAVGDSEGDIPMLEMVGHPITFNPSDYLARLAQKKGWKIVVERKDVVYEVKKCSFIKITK